MNPALTKILDDMKRQRELFHLDQGGLGAALLKAATDGVQASLLAQQTPDGQSWDDLSEDYAKWKGQHFPGKPMGKLHDVMADPVEVAGEPSISSDRATVIYGVTDQARQEAVWFSEGDPGRGRPARPFWGLTEASLLASQKILDDRFDTIR